MRPLEVFVGGACYQDVILHVDSYPREDAKVRANSVERRRGGNGANVLQVLSQFQLPPHSSFGPSNSPPPPLGMLSTSLVAVLAGNPPSSSGSQLTRESSFIVNDFISNSPNVSLDHCLFRGSGYSEPTAWIIATGSSRTIVNHTTLPELTAAEFRATIAPVLDRSFTAEQPNSLWFHFEGRNVTEMEMMVDWLIARRQDAVSKCTSSSTAGWWKSAASNAWSFDVLKPASNGVSDASGPNLGVSPGDNVLGRRESRETVKSSSPGAENLIHHQLHSISRVQNACPEFTISVEFEKPNRPGLDNLLTKADILFFSKWYAEGKGFPNAPTGFLDNIRRECKPYSVLLLTWAEQGCFLLVNDPSRPAHTHHIPAPKIYPVDTIGAGDTFAAGMIYGVGLQGWDVKSACEFAVRLATAKCAQVGFDGLAERFW
ncbi:hypothetical protein HDU83_004598 [Entophlyctis luteolus]|nr:hypothetical protein HDU83_004598 [Entophlyctis luteolus]KAJ3382145.1 hypothetical protein HDU84_004593 [Entophlyctis sp. JEL0112]